MGEVTPWGASAYLKMTEVRSTHLLQYLPTSDRATASFKLLQFVKLQGGDGY